MKFADISVPLIGIFAIGLFSAFLIIKNKERVEAESRAYQSYVFASRVVALGLDGTTLEESFGKRLIEYMEEEQPLLVMRISSEGCQPCAEMLFDELESVFPEYKSDSRIILWTPKEFGDVPMPNIVTGPQKNTTVLFIYKNGRVEHSFVPSSLYPKDMEHYLRLVQSKYFPPEN